MDGKLKVPLSASLTSEKMASISTLAHTHLIHKSLDDVHQTEQDGMQAEEDIIGTDRVNSIRIPLQKLLLRGDDTAT